MSLRFVGAFWRTSFATAAARKLGILPADDPLELREAVRLWRRADIQHDQVMDRVLKPGESLSQLEAELDQIDQIRWEAQARTTRLLGQ